ncbi:TPA: hypothetical protein ACL819_001675 [Streptococcus pneumoniae]|uniref:hypothetical protein n=1 Tax=Streptococcus pneumoniae TaxID=1313 RepID=UPI0003283C07|nr:hypothetical protein [Streptococcus pneumoniae]EOB29908.1 hypothetical protein C944_00615 [Streptococcus pneumoniae 357]EPR96168.1 hypothetical protein M057_00560 [Streptococcus pneumoniae 1779n23_04]SBV76421.1 hypothetical protein SP46464_0194 [Streptococcus pneumoniae]VIY20044.1 Uncharacterised protein [Streptococcus pneumoniae]VTD20427.1 Uncharacterised protein [Streptococcus pneumoniae]
MRFYCEAYEVITEEKKVYFNDIELEVKYSSVEELFIICEKLLDKKKVSFFYVDEKPLRYLLFDYIFLLVLAKKISDLNDKKEFHKKNCELRFQDSVLDNINSVPSTTHLFSCLNIQTLVKIILYIFRYNSCMKIFNFRDKELIFFNKIVNGLIQNIEENLEDDIERILKYLYICLFNEIFIIKNKVNFFDDVEFNQTLSEFLDKL